ncbi:MAG TPA: sulfite exporter TauE/SafE family protein [Melioribacteraceae bacterium]|nr:sulfite exporter TauE/SafE family protein [Melioribacteraceae bacterium]
MTFDLFFIVLILFIASFVQGFSGFGLAIISIPLLSLFLNIKHVIPLVALLGLLLNLLLFIELRKNIKFNDLINLYFGSIIGIPLGIYFFTIADVKVLKGIVATILLIFVTINFIKNLQIKSVKPIYGYLTGLFAGFLGGAINTNGPPVLIYQKMISQNKTNFKSSITGYYIVNSLIIVSLHFATGITQKFVIINFIQFSPIIILGYYLGNKVFNKINTVFFNKIILFLLLFIAIVIITNI